MGALRADITLSNASGRNVAEISEIFIWRTEGSTTATSVLVGESDVNFLPDDPTFTYYATRVPPADVEWIDDRSFTRPEYSQVLTPHVKFQHRYNDGAEICIARAILALHEAGMNV